MQQPIAIETTCRVGLE